MYGLGSFFTTSPREAATRLSSRCPNSSDTHLFVALVLYFREYFSISLRFTLNSKLPEPLRPSLPGLKTAVSGKEIQQVKCGRFAIIETIKKPKSLYPFIQSFFLPSFWLETVIVMDIQPVSSLQLHTLCAFSIKNNRNWFFIYKGNGHTGSFPGHIQLKTGRKLSPGLIFTQTQQICAIGITFLTNRHQNPIVPP